MATYFSFHAYVYCGRGGPLGRSLEQVACAMSALQGLFFEWDGSLVWANQAAGWQINATIFDDGLQVRYIDLHVRSATPPSLPILKQRLLELAATWGDLEELRLLRLPERRWQNLQAFAKESSPLP